MTTKPFSEAKPCDVCTCGAPKWFHLSNTERHEGVHSEKPCNGWEYDRDCNETEDTSSTSSQSKPQRTPRSHAELNAW
jgi:hypothetical protein